MNLTIKSPFGCDYHVARGILQYKNPSDIIRDYHILTEAGDLAEGAFAKVGLVVFTQPIRNNEMAPDQLENTIGYKLAQYVDQERLGFVTISTIARNPSHPERGEGAGNQALVWAIDLPALKHWATKQGVTAETIKEYQAKKKKGRLW